MKEVQKRLSSFLWSGYNDVTRKAKVAWADICKPLDEGGLGLKPLEEANKIAILKQFWHMYTNKSSIWGSWVRKILLKDNSIWSITIPTDGSWAWKKLLKFRELAGRHIKHIIGNGVDTFLWRDVWHPSGRLAHNVQHDIILSSRLGLQSRVKEIIRDGSWRWPRCLSSFDMVIRLDPHRADTVVWDIGNNGCFETATTWKTKRTTYPKVPWFHLIWKNSFILKHSCCTWLAILGRLPTKDRLMSWGIQISGTCVLCNMVLETKEHLFFECSFSRQIWRSCAKQAKVKVIALLELIGKESFGVVATLAGRKLSRQ